MSNTSFTRIKRCLLTLSVTTIVALAAAGGFQEMVANSAEEAKPLKVGAIAPDAALKSLDGTDIRLKKVLGSKPTVLIFYRGGWCPFCNAHLSELATIEGDIRKHGYQIIAISPDLPVELNHMTEKDHLNYKLYSDSTAEAMKKFGVAFRVDDATFTKYRDDYHVDLEAYSGQTHHILPVPSVFIINRRGKITFAHSNPDFKVRLKGAEILKALK